MTDDPEPRQGPLTRFFKAVVSPVHRLFLGSLLDRQNQLARSLHEMESTVNHLVAVEPILREQKRFLAKLETMLAAATTHIEALENARITTIDDIGLLRDDAGRAQDHLAALQDQSSVLQQAIEELKTRGNRFEDLWTDLHRDMTALAEAFSRVEKD